MQCLVNYPEEQLLWRIWNIMEKIKEHLSMKSYIVQVCFSIEGTQLASLYLESCPRSYIKEISERSGLKEDGDGFSN